MDKPKASKARNTKIYPVTHVLEKYNITPAQFQEIAQESLNPQKHIQKAEDGSMGLTIQGLMMIGRTVKKRDRATQAVHDDKQDAIKKVEANADLIREIQVCEFKPPNKLKLWGIDPITSTKVIINVPRKIHDGAKKGTMLLCERIDDGLFSHPPLDA